MTIPREYAMDISTHAVRTGLDAELSALNQLAQGLGDRMAQFVATGEPGGVLDELAASADAATALRIMGSDNGERPVYALLESLPPVAMMRYAKCLAAVPAATAYIGRLGRVRLSTQALWPDVLLMHAARNTFVYHSVHDIHAALSADYMERMLIEDGLPAETLVTAAFLTPVETGFTTASHERIARMTGFMDALLRHPEAARPALRSKVVGQRALALKLLRAAPVEVLSCFAGEIAACATGKAKQGRIGALPLLRNTGAPALEPLQAIARDGDPESRSLALEAIWEIGAGGAVPAAMDFVRARREKEKTRSVLQTIEQLESRISTEPGAEPLPIPDLPQIDMTQPLPESLRPAFDRMVDDINRSIVLKHEHAAKYNYSIKLDSLTPADADHMWSYLCGRTEEPPASAEARTDRQGAWEVDYEMSKFLLNDGVAPLHTVRVYQAFKRVKTVGDRPSMDGYLVGAVNEHYRVHKRPTLLELEALVATVGIDAAMIARAYWVGLATQWGDADVWPFFARHMEAVRDWLKLERPETFWHSHAPVFRVVAAFPEPPAELVPRLFEIALGGAKADRVRAQAALDKFGDRDPRIIAALGDGKAEARGEAARWLGRLKCVQAAPALEAALRKETKDACIGAMMSALEALGVDVDKFLDRGNLPQEAAKGLAKGIPAALAWFPWDTLPEVHWASPSSRPSPKGEGEKPPSPLGEGRGEGHIVPPEVLKWFIVQATKLKSPEPHALLRRYATMFVAAERERFGQFVLEAWLDEDVSGSAIESKGVLAVAAACCGREAAPAVASYLKEWYGTRAAQGKTLIAMLGWIEHPTATQLMLSVGHRFRTKGFQDEAMVQANALAERKGWTVAELADRTIPPAGFDENGVLELPYGSRTLTARLGERYKVEIYNEDGKKIAALPEPRHDDNPFLAAEAKRALAAAKKEVKTTLQAQGERLYEALCTERTWRYEDWEMLLNRHAVVRRLLQGLVWAEFRGGKVASTFRPLDDGTLTDLSDNAVTLTPDARVGLAHDTNLDAQSVAAWRKHLADYEVAAPFQQLGKGAYALPEALNDRTEIEDFRLHVIGAFALRARAGALGYQRGAQDGSWFYDYRKRFPTLGLEATIAFSGARLPEEDSEVSLTSLAFLRIPVEQGGEPRARLGTVPAVLLSECYNDLRLIAAEGKGPSPHEQ